MQSAVCSLQSAVCSLQMSYTGYCFYIFVPIIRKEHFDLYFDLYFGYPQN